MQRRTTTGRGRADDKRIWLALLAATTMATAVLALPLGQAIPPAVQAVPVQATGLLGTLHPEDGATILFDTSTGLYSINGVAQNDVTRRRELRPETASGASSPQWAFDFDSIRLGPGTAVVVQGEAPFLLLAKAEVSIGTSLVLDGAPGLGTGKGAGGGGGGGGGALAILAQGPLTFTGRVSVDGGAGGVGDVVDGHPLDPSRSRGGAGGAGTVLMGSAHSILFDGSVDARTGGLPAAPAGPVTLVGPVTFGPNALVNGGAAAAAGNLHQAASLALQDLRIVGGGGGAGAGGSGLLIDGFGNERRDGYADAGGAGGRGAPGGGSGGHGAHAVAGGAGGNGGSGGNAAGGAADAGGSGGGGGGGGAYNGPGGSGGSGGSGSFTGLTGSNGSNGAAGGCASGPHDGGDGGDGAASAVAGGTGGAGGSGSPAGTDGSAGAAGNAPGSGTPSADGGGGGGGGGADGGDGGAGGNGGPGSSDFGDGGGGGGGGGGGADSCDSGVPPGSGGNGGNGGTGTNSGANGNGGGGGGSGTSTSASTTQPPSDAITRQFDAFVFTEIEFKDPGFGVHSPTSPCPTLLFGVRLLVSDIIYYQSDRVATNYKLGSVELPTGQPPVVLIAGPCPIPGSGPGAPVFLSIPDTNVHGPYDAVSVDQILCPQGNGPLPVTCLPQADTGLVVVSHCNKDDTAFAASPNDGKSALANLAGSRRISCTDLVSDPDDGFKYSVTYYDGAPTGYVDDWFFEPGLWGTDFRLIQNEDTTPLGNGIDETGYQVACTAITVLVIDPNKTPSQYEMRLESHDYKLILDLDGTNGAQAQLLHHDNNLQGWHDLGGKNGFPCPEEFLPPDKKGDFPILPTPLSPKK